MIDKISPDVLKSSTKNGNMEKRIKPYNHVTSDFIVHAPDILFYLLSWCLKSCMVHAHVIGSHLTSMIINLLRDNRCHCAVSGL